MNNIQLGLKGELIARNYLDSKKYKIICTNWTCRWGELDIIAELDNELIFVEVKYRKSFEKIFVQELIPKKKAIALERTINNYLQTEKLTEYDWKLDLIYIFKRGNDYAIKHYKSISF